MDNDITVGRERFYAQDATGTDYRSGPTFANVTAHLPDPIDVTVDGWTITEIGTTRGGTWSRTWKPSLDDTGTRVEWTSGGWVEWTPAAASGQVTA